MKKFLALVAFASGLGLARGEITGLITTPGGDDNQVQVNDNGLFGGDSSFTYNGTTVTLPTLSATTISATTLSATSGTITNLVPGGLTSGRIPYYNGTKLVDDADLSFNGSTITATGISATTGSITNLIPGGLTSGRIPYFNGTKIVDDADLSFNGSTMTATGLSASSAAISGSLSAATINTGQGDNEVYPMDQLNGMRNRILNGEMLVDQNKEGSSYTTASKMAEYGLDQWRYEDTNSTSDFSITRTTESLPTGFRSAMRMTSITTATVVHDDGVNMEYPMEPGHMRDFLWGTSDAKTITLSFWALSSVDGTYSISFLNGVNSRSYVSTYTLSQNVWKYNTITVPGDTDGTPAEWPTSGDVFGLKVVWDLGSGSDVETSSLNQWISGSKWKATGSTSLTGGPGFISLYLTGVQLEIGTSATEFEFRSPELELHMLQRYYFKTLPQGTAFLSGQGSTGAPAYSAQTPGLTAGGGVYVRFPVEMRAIPTITTYSSIIGGGNTYWYNVTAGAVSGAPSAPSPGPGGCFIYNPQVSGDSAGDVMTIQISANARLGGS